MKIMPVPHRTQVPRPHQRQLRRHKTRHLRHRQTTKIKLKKSSRRATRVTLTDSNLVAISGIVQLRVFAKDGAKKMPHWVRTSEASKVLLQTTQPLDERDCESDRAHSNLQLKATFQLHKTPNFVEDSRESLHSNLSFFHLVIHQNGMQIPQLIRPCHGKFFVVVPGTCQIQY